MCCCYWRRLGKIADDKEAGPQIGGFEEMSETKKARIERAFSISVCGDSATQYLSLVFYDFKRLLSSTHDHHSTECRTAEKEEQDP